MTKQLLVLALARGYYGGAIKEPGEEFTIKHEDDLGSWMLPQGWSKAKPKPTKASKAAAAKINSEKVPTKPEDAKPLLFKGMKDEYGTDDHKFQSSEILTHALEEYEHDVKSWNELSDAERQKALMASVGALVNDAQADVGAT